MFNGSLLLIFYLLLNAGCFRKQKGRKCIKSEIFKQLVGEIFLDNVFFLILFFAVYREPSRVIDGVDGAARSYF